MSIVEAIDTVLLTRPRFNDEHLGNEGLWVLDNAAALARYWQQLGRALGVDDPEGEEDIELFCKEQHTQRMRDRCGFMLPHGGSL